MDAAGNTAVNKVAKNSPVVLDLEYYRSVGLGAYMASAIYGLDDEGEKVIGETPLGEDMIEAIMLELAHKGGCKHCINVHKSAFLKLAPDEITGAIMEELIRKTILFLHMDFDAMTEEMLVDWKKSWENFATKVNKKFTPTAADSLALALIFYEKKPMLAKYHGERIRKIGEYSEKDYSLLENQLRSIASFMSAAIIHYATRDYLR